MTKRTEDSWVISIDASHTQILNKTLQDRIIRTIREKEGNPELTIDFVPATKVIACPSALAEARYTEKLAQIHEKIAKDVNIAALLQQFNATILEDSVKLK